MASPKRELLSNGLPNNQRLITTTNAEGKAILEPSISPNPTWQPIGEDMNFFLGYSTRKFPVSLSTDPSSNLPADLTVYNKDYASPPGLSISTGTVLRFVDVAPGVACPMHKTASLDYGVVIEGSFELELDSGEKWVVHRGDVCVQRATNHAWRNVSGEGKWARMMFVLTAAEKGEGVEEKGIEGMEGLKGSD
ncbi:hypothetical protein CJF32_00001513 [Rutstroemia sp. NJR-2017a WRK4]|nr:hypothetical protein CJF32_00001513 [Rutstroemia sp. NJR-2017a WRK4]